MHRLQAPGSILLGPVLTGSARRVARIRQHVNPLLARFQVPIQAPDWAALYETPSQPFLLDIGCGFGEFSQAVAKAYPSMNVLGIEIRERAAEEANQKIASQGLRNVAVVSGNINVSIESLLSKLPGPIMVAALLHPDPWFKAKHVKRRVLSPKFVEELASVMPVGARLVLQTDVRELDEDMHSTMAQCTGQFQRLPTPTEPLFHVRTAREVFVLGQGGEVFRSAFLRH